MLPAFRAHLGSLKEPPFALLEYDGGVHHGQVWLKHQIHRALESAEPTKRERLRFVLYLPMTEDRLDSPNADGPALDLLAEYRISGFVWRIGGKRPSLFLFLRQAGVPLPEGQAEQRRLYEGGRDSLLTKYAAKFAGRPPAFWTQTLTPQVAQGRLIGDVDQMILDVAADPDGGWQELHEKGLEREFLDTVRERYGFVAPEGSPIAWVLELVTALALTEAYLGYGEPADFPFADRLPPIALRPHHVQLLQRWLRDSDARPAYDHCVEKVETQVDLSLWAKGRPGVSFAFPHLVRMRWQEVRSAFEEAAPKTSTVAAFFVDYEDLIEKEAQYVGRSWHAVGAWSLLQRLKRFLDACDDAERCAACVDGVSELADVYVSQAGAVECQHLVICCQAEEEALPAARQIADRAYASYATALNDRFFERLARSGRPEVPGIEPVTTHLENVIWKAKGKRAVVIVDALRFDCALAIQELLVRDHVVQVEPLVAALPTITPIGMTALMPLSNASVAIEVKGNGVHPMVNGKDMSVRENRLAYLRSAGADCREINELESQSEPPKALRELLVVFGHDEVDHIGHGEAQNLIRHLTLEVERLARLIRTLHRWGYPEVHVITDHGFVLLDEERLPPEVRCEREWCLVRKERFALVPASAEVPLTTFPCAWEASMRVAVPPGLAFFSAEKSFSHGGAALQELVIPHLVSKGRAALERKIDVEVVLPSFELIRTAVKVVLRPRPPAAEVAGQMALTVAKGRKVVLDVTAPDSHGKRTSVLASGPKEIRLEMSEDEHAVTLFFRTSLTLRKGDVLDLEIKDSETGEELPPGGIKLTAGRDM